MRKYKFKNKISPFMASVVINIGINAFLGCFEAEKVAKGIRNTFNMETKISNTWASVVYD